MNLQISGKRSHSVLRRTRRIVTALLMPLLGGTGWSATSNSVTQYGVTWTFAASHQVGQYVNGDWWVVGPVTITKITPESTTDETGWTKNGTMVNPVPATVSPAQGFDSSVKKYAWWNASLNKAPKFTGSPLYVAAGSSVLSSISLSTPNTDTSKPQLSEAEVLTVVSSPPPTGSFRPPIVGTDKTHRWNITSLRYDILSKLAPVSSTPSLTTVEGYFERPWLALQEAASVQAMSPVNNMPNYGRDQAQRLSLGLLSLHLNYSNSQKEKLYVRLVQYGIDIYGSLKAGMVFTDNGGTNAGRKAPLVLAGLALNDSELLEWANAQKHFVFQEDRQTWFVTQADVGRVVYTGDGRPRVTYSSEHVGMPEWGVQHTSYPKYDASNWASAYYRWIGGSWHGNLLAIMLTAGGEAAWNYKPVFAYADRYWSIEGGKGQANQSFTAPNNISLFVYDMWAAYRGTPAPPATGKVATPQISPIPGHYDSAQQITLSCSTSGAAIRYTTNGSEPTASSTLYAGPISLFSDSTVKAKAFLTGLTDSAVMSGDYTFGVAVPTISPNGGNYFGTSASVSMSCTTSGAAIRYTTDGTVPSASSKLYSGPFQVTSSANVNAIGVKSGLANSPVANARFDYGPFEATTDWTNVALAPKTSSFTIVYDYVPGGAPVDSVVGLSTNPAESYANLACIVRFNDQGLVDARNGSSYQALATLAYAKNVRYTVSLSVDMVAKTYSATVTPDSGSPVVIAQNFGFRTEQASAASLAFLALVSESSEISTVTVISDTSGITPPPLDQPNPPANIKVKEKPDTSQQ